MSDLTTSVIIPCYNRAEMLREAIQSALDQTCPPLEVIVVDDGSTDNSAAVAKSFGPPVRTLRQANAGAAAARNAALDVAKGEFVAFLDSDDLWKPEKLEVQLAAFEARPHLSLVHSLVEWGEGFPDGYGTRAEANAHYPDEGDDWTRLFRDAVMYTPCVMARRSVLERAGPFHVDLHYWEDMNLWLRAALHGPVGLVQERLVVLRRRPSADGRSPSPWLPVHWSRAYSRALASARETIGPEEYRRCRSYLREQQNRRMHDAFWDRNLEAMRHLCVPVLRHGPGRWKALAFLALSVLPERLVDRLT